MDEYDEPRDEIATMIATDARERVTALEFRLDMIIGCADPGSAAHTAQAIEYALAKLRELDKRLEYVESQP